MNVFLCNMTTVAELVVESREDIPLKRGRKSTKWYNCNEDFFSGSKYINFAFGTLTFVITLALLIQIYYGDYQVVPHGSVATDSLECSKIGTVILKKGGNAADAAIASAFCLAVTTPHVTGLDAEGHLLIYNHKTRLAPDVIDFSHSNAISEHLPRLVLGLVYVHQQYGSLSWKDLVEPAAHLARQGYVISPMMVKALTSSEAEYYGHLEPGQLLQLEQLAETLEQIANISENELYSFLNDVNKPQISQAIQVPFSNHAVFVPSNISVGNQLENTLKEIEKFNFTRKEGHESEYAYHLADIIKSISTEEHIGEKFHEGTFSNVAAIDKDDGYVSLVTGMYNFFGSGEVTTHGYVLDVVNKTKPCSRVAMIIIDRNYICGRRMVFGANELSSATQLVTSLLTANENITDSIEAPRFHIFINGSIGIEEMHLPSFGKETLENLETFSSKLVIVSEPYQSINIVEKVKDDLSSHSDSRGGGIAVRF